MGTGPAQRSRLRPENPQTPKPIQISIHNQNINTLLAPSSTASHLRHPHHPFFCHQRLRNRTPLLPFQTSHHRLSVTMATEVRQLLRSCCRCSDRRFPPSPLPPRSRNPSARLFAASCAASATRGRAQKPHANSILVRPRPAKPIIFSAPFLTLNRMLTLSQRERFVQQLAP